MYFDAHEFGKRVKALRTEKGLTQEKLAEMLNISFSQISRIESGRSTPSIDVMIELAELFQVSLDYLILGRESATENVRNTLLELADGLKALAMGI